MNLKKGLLKRLRLYVILDRAALRGKPPEETAAKIKNSGVGIIQLRDKASGKDIILKEAQALGKALLKSRVLFLVNDYLDVAKIADCDGIHLGQNDSSVEIARKILGEEKVIGISCHNLAQAFKAKEDGADYVSIGPVFPTPLKPNKRAVGLDLIRKIQEKIKIPCFAIGGINEKNTAKVLKAGIKRIVVCRAICEAKNPLSAAKQLSKAIG